MIYATEVTSPASSSITFTNTATLTDMSVGVGNGGSIYLDNPVIDVYMNTAVTLTKSYAKNGYGGVFYVN